MALMNAETTILIALACVACLAIIKKRNKSRKLKLQKQKTKDSYDDFHLGEMTHYDLPAGYTKRDVDVKWNGSARVPEAQKNESKINIKKENIKKENSNGKESK